MPTRWRAFRRSSTHGRTPQGIGFQTVQGLLALGTGGRLGIGLGESRQPGLLHLPQAHNDFVFAVVGRSWASSVARL